MPESGQVTPAFDGLTVRLTIEAFPSPGTPEDLFDVVFEQFITEGASVSAVLDSGPAFGAAVEAFTNRTTETLALMTSIGGSRARRQRAFRRQRIPRVLRSGSPTDP